MIEQLALVIVLNRTPDAGQSPAVPFGASAVLESDLLIRYRFENAAFDISRIELSIDGTGRGRVTWTKRNVAKPQLRDFAVSGQGIAVIREQLRLLNFLNSSEMYQAKEDHANLGETRIRVDQGGANREVCFNYTKNRDADALGRLLRGVANREIYVSELEVAMIHQPLDTPAILTTMEREFKLGRIADAVALVPLLRKVADDAALPLIARNKATELLGKIQPAK